MPLIYLIIIFLSLLINSLKAQERPTQSHQISLAWELNSYVFDKKSSDKELLLIRQSLGFSAELEYRFSPFLRKKLFFLVNASYRYQRFFSESYLSFNRFAERNDLPGRLTNTQQDLALPTTALGLGLRYTFWQPRPHIACFFTLNSKIHLPIWKDDYVGLSQGSISFDTYTGEQYTGKVFDLQYYIPAKVPKLSATFLGGVELAAQSQHPISLGLGLTYSTPFGEFNYTGYNYKGEKTIQYRGLIQLSSIQLQIAVRFL